MLALVPSTRPLALTCQYRVAPDHTWEIDGPRLRLTGEVRFVCTVCLESDPGRMRQAVQEQRAA